MNRSQALFLERVVLSLSQPGAEKDDDRNYEDGPYSYRESKAYHARAWMKVKDDGE